MDITNNIINNSDQTDGNLIIVLPDGTKQFNPTKMDIERCIHLIKKKCVIPHFLLKEFLEIYIEQLLILFAFNCDLFGSFSQENNYNNNNDNYDNINYNNYDMEEAIHSELYKFIKDANYDMKEGIRNFIAKQLSDDEILSKINYDLLSFLPILDYYDEIFQDKIINYTAEEFDILTFYICDWIHDLINTHSTGTSLTGNFKIQKLFIGICKKVFVNNNYYDVENLHLK